MTTRSSTYKPLLFTTTMRSPERLRAFLGILKNYDGKVLTNELTEEISGEIIRLGLYTPTKLTATVKIKMKARVPLTDGEVKRVLKDNPQQHKEAGFNEGWPSRFDTWFKIAKELGFVFYRIGDEIQFSEIGTKLVDSEGSRFEQEAFLNGFVKYQSNNPFRRVLNENVPLVLLLEVIQKLNDDPSFNDAGISKLEIPLVLYWKDNNADALYKRIKKLREKFRYSPSDEVIVDICRNEIMGGGDIIRNTRSITGDYPDEFIRKMRLTGLISLRGGGRFIDLNKNEQAKIDYILKNYVVYKKYKTEESYFAYLSTIDKNLVSAKTKQPTSAQQDQHFKKWLQVYSWNAIRAELLSLSGRQLTSDQVLKYLTTPVRLEFLIALAIKSKYPDIIITPNYPVDDEGIPTSTAAGTGNTGDIECYEAENGILVEVTMSEGRIQTMMEVWPIERHLKEFRKKAPNALCYFIAPSIYPDSVRQIGYVKKTEGLIIYPKTIADFLNHLEKQKSLYNS